MATVIVAPINMTSFGGYLVQIQGITPSNHDCIKGTINTPGMGLIHGNWNLSGLLRGGDHSCNLDMRTNEMIDLVQLAIRLGAER